MDRLVDRIYQASLEESRWQDVLAEVASACGARAAVLLVSDRLGARLSFTDEVGLDTAYRSIYLQRLRFEDLRLQDLLRHPLGTVRTDTMIERYQDYLASRAYRELYSRLGTEHALGAFLIEEERERYGLRLFRSRRDGPFAEAEVRCYRRLVPHLARALKLRRRGEALLRESRAGAAALDLMPWALFRLSEGRRPLPMNAAARRLAEERPGLEAALARQADTEGRRLAHLSLVHSGQRESWHCRMKPLDGQGGLIALLAPADRPPQPPATLAGDLAGLFGLTAAEAGLVARLVAGDSLSVAAAGLGIAHETARTHLRNSFAKTRTRRQAELVRLAGTSLAALSEEA